MKLGTLTSIALAAALTGIAMLTTIATAQPAISPLPKGELLFDDYQVTVAKKPVPVYSCRVSAMPFNQVWPGYQRPLEQTELAGFAYWDMRAPVKVVVRSKKPVKTVVVRPTTLGIKPRVKKDQITFTLRKPGYVVLEINGIHHALHLFASSPAKNAPDPNAPRTRYFGPGVHHTAIIQLTNNETVYIASGAVVYGSFKANNVSNLRILGRGIIDGKNFGRDDSFGAIHLTGCSNVTVNGVILRDPNVWACSLFVCQNVQISNLKLIGLWRYNTDGIDICNSQDVTVRDCFIRSFDDSIVLKGIPGEFSKQPVRNIHVNGCVVWNDWGKALEIGAETHAPDFSAVVFEDSDIIHSTHVAFAISNTDWAKVRDIRYQNIRVEFGDDNPRPVYQASRDARFEVKPNDDFLPFLIAANIPPGAKPTHVENRSIQNITFENISVVGPRMPPSFLRGIDAEHSVDGVTIKNLRLNGKPVRDIKAARLDIGPHVQNVRIE